MLTKRVTTFILMLLIMFADSGQTIYEHTCLKSKRTQLSFGQPKSCCAQKVDTGTCEVKKSSCCEVSSKYLKQHFVNQQAVTGNVVVDVAVVPVSQILVAVHTPLIQSAANSSPPLPAIAKSEGTFTQTFRI